MDQCKPFRSTVLPIFDFDQHTTATMLWTNIKYFAKLPFLNLTIRARVIFALRLCTLLIAIVLGFVVIDGKAQKSPLLVLHSSRLDLARGLYDSLKDAFSGEKNFLTTSEIKIMAEYIETQIKNTPEGIRSGLFDWCSVSYNTPDLGYLDESDFGDLVVEDDLHLENMTLSCKDYGKHYVFDYRGELSDIGLNIILAYAYTADFQDSQSSTLSETAYVPDAAYLQDLKHRQEAVHRFFVVMIMSICAQMMMFLGTFVYYSRRKNEMDDSKISVWVKNLFAVFSAFNWILAFVAFIGIFLQMRNVQMHVRDELSTYGIYMKYGPTFVSIMVVWFCFCTLIFALWAGPVWFNRSLKKTADEQAQIPLSMDAYDYDYNYDDDNDYDNDFGNTTDYNGEGEMYDFEDRHSSRSINTTDSYENNDKTSDTRISSHTSSASSSQDHGNPFSTAFTNSDAALSTVEHKSMFYNSAFMRSDELFNKRKPPLLNELALNNEHLIPMSPIVHPIPTGTSTLRPVVPSIQVDDSPHKSKREKIPQ